MRSATGGDCSLASMELEARDGTLMERLHIEWVTTGPERVSATMPVEGNTQPHGFLHGGATAALIESAASLGASLAAGDDHRALCIDLSVSHLRAVQAGIVTAIATPLRAGRTVSVWDVQMHDDADDVVAVGRCTFVVRSAT